MPIRKELRRFYGREWYEVVRPRILRRAGGRFTRAGRYQGGSCCEACGKPDRKLIYVFTDRVVFSPGDVRPFMFWVGADESVWRDQFGQRFPGLKLRGLPRKIRNVLQVAHLNHVPGDDRDENLKAYCAWHHLNHDAIHHRDTRCRRKDSDRPLLASMGLYLPQPLRAEYVDEIAYCRAMQFWAVGDGDGPQRSICIDDWFAEELIILAERGSGVGA